MSGEKLHVKNMVCARCKMAVRNVLEGSGYRLGSVELGEVEMLSPFDPRQIDALLKPLGFELLDDKRSRLIERVKTLIIELIYDKNNDLRSNLSDYLADKTRQDYGQVSHVFSQMEGITIEQFYIVQKIERAKELLAYGEMNVNEIADALNYSSAPHLSRQFKKITGMTPGEFRKLRPVRTGLAPE